MTAPLAITKDMRVLDIITLCPQAEAVMGEYGLHCFHCEANAFESLQDGCLSHGFEDEEIDELVDDINELLKDAPARPQTLTVTAAAASAIKDIAASENRAGEGLSVIVDGRGGFCMEFRKDPEADEQIFRNEETPDVRVFASAITLSRIGGSTIDFREGRFKLDLAEADEASSACGCQRTGACGCGKS